MPVQQTVRETFPSGKAVIREFDEAGRPIREMHSYGTLDIGITLEFQNGVKTNEMYFAKRRMVTRKSYDKHRANYPDMPAPDSFIEDLGADLLRGAREERKQWQSELKNHRPISEHARKLDEFCEHLMKQGRCEDAVTWIKNKQHTLGERNWSSSKRLVDKFVALGCSRIVACKIDAYDDGLENTGHLIVELPSEDKIRRKVLDAIDRLASKEGYRGNLDDGQRYSYIKLD